MEYKEATAVLCDIERNVAVERLRYGDIAAWPLIRLALWRQLTDEVAETGSTLTFLSRLRSRIDYARFIFRSFFRRRTDLPKADAVFLVTEGERRYAEIGGEMTSPFADSLREYAGGFGITSVTFDASREDKPYGRPCSLDFDTAIICLRERFRRKLMMFLPSRSESIEAFDEIATYVRRAHPQLVVDEVRIIAELNLIGALKKFYLGILKTVTPKAAFLVCYYNADAMAYILACRELGIRTIDIQHGQQGDYHGMYANWTKPERYGLLPDLFWCWGEQSAERINRWSRPIWPVHHGLVGGNPWMARQIHCRGPAEEEAALDKLVVPGKIRVLLALQPLPDAIPAPLLRAIATSPPNIQWLVRLHPMMRGWREEEMRNQLTGTGNTNIEMDISSSLLLAGLLRRVDFIVTLWSSVAYEALLFGVHPVIVHENGLKTFHNYIERGLFSYAASAENILAVLMRTKSEFNFHEDVPYIETREDVIREKLNWVMSASDVVPVK